MLRSVQQMVSSAPRASHTPPHSTFLNARVALSPVAPSSSSPVLSLFARTCRTRNIFFADRFFTLVCPVIHSFSHSTAGDKPPPPSTLAIIVNDQDEVFDCLPCLAALLTWCVCEHVEIVTLSYYLCWLIEERNKILSSCVVE